MKSEEFNNLTEKEKRELLCDAIKVAEEQDDLFRYEIFRVDDLYIETRVSLKFKQRRGMKTMTHEEFTSALIPRAF